MTLKRAKWLEEHARKQWQIMCKKYKAEGLTKTTALKPVQLTEDDREVDKKKKNARLVVE